MSPFRRSSPTQPPAAAIFDQHRERWMASARFAAYWDCVGIRLVPPARVHGTPSTRVSA
jgi:hypothetical protein